MSFFLGKVIVVLRHPAARNVGGETPLTKGIKASKYAFVVYYIYTFNNGLIWLWIKCSETTILHLLTKFWVILIFSGKFSPVAWHAAISFKMLVIPWIVMFLSLEDPHTPLKTHFLLGWTIGMKKDEFALPVFLLGPVFCFSCPNRCLPCYMWAASWSPLYNISVPRSDRHLCNATATAGIRHMPFVVYTLRHLLCNLSSKQPSISHLIPE